MINTWPVILTIINICILLIIFFQDLKERLVTGFLYPASAILFYIILVLRTDFYRACAYSIVNFTSVCLILFISYLYMSVIKKRGFLNKSIGLGDLLFFVAVSVGFSTTPFIVLLVFSLVFSLVMHNILKNRSNHQTVPLAGYMALFFAGIYILSLFVEPKYFFA